MHEQILRVTWQAEDRERGCQSSVRPMRSTKWDREEEKTGFQTASREKTSSTYACRNSHKTLTPTIRPFPSQQPFRRSSRRSREITENGSLTLFLAPLNATRIMVSSRAATASRRRARPPVRQRAHTKQSCSIFSVSVRDDDAKDTYIAP